MLLPTIVAIISAMIMIMAVFVWAPTPGHCMPRHFTMAAPGEAPAGGAVAAVDEEGSGLELTAPPSATMAVMAEECAPKGTAVVQDVEEGEPVRASSRALLMTAPKTRHAKVVVFGTILFLLSIVNFLRAELRTISFVSALIMLGVDLAVCHRDGHSKLSFLARVYGRLPWPIAPFVLCMFILYVRTHRHLWLCMYDVYMYWGRIELPR